MTTEQMNLIVLPPDGLIVYNITIKSLYWYNGTTWKQFNEESDPIFGASASAGITPTLINNWNTAYNNAAASVHIIGESYGGGKVFYVYDGGRHGLIASTSDQSAGIQWYNGTEKYTGTTGDGLGAGEMNTAMIVSAQTGDNQNDNFAAKVCADYSVTVGGINYGDWYLPSKYELNLLFLQKAAVGTFANGDYWSSTELSASNAWTQYFYDGFQSDYGKNGAGYVRAIRAF
jgi:hypothetical protein